MHNRDDKSNLSQLSPKDMAESLLNQPKLTRGKPKIVDVTECDYQQAKELLTKLIKAGFLLHGTNTGGAEPHRVLKPQKGHDIYRESGRKTGVYATDNSTAIFPWILLDRHSIRSRFDSLVTSFKVNDEGRPSVGFSRAEAVQYVKENRSEVFGDGYVYVLEKADFSLSEGSRHEYFAPNKQTPLFILKIGGQIADELFTTGGENPTIYESEVDKSNP